MANIKRWSDKLDKKLIKHMEKGKEKGISISLLAEEFSQMHPEFTSSKVRSHYYQLINTIKYKDKEYDFKTWTLEEDTKLLKFVKENNNKKTKIEIFEEFALQNKRNPQAVASHYYQLLNKIKNNHTDKIFNLSYVLDNIDKDKLKMVDDIIEKLKLIKEIDDQTQRVILLEETINTLSNCSL